MTVNMAGIIVDRLKERFGEKNVRQIRSNSHVRIVRIFNAHDEGVAVWLYDDKASFWFDGDFISVSYADPDFFDRLVKMIAQAPASGEAW